MYYSNRPASPRSLKEILPERAADLIASSPPPPPPTDDPTCLQPSAPPPRRGRDERALYEQLKNAACQACYDRGFRGNLETPCTCAAGVRYAGERAMRALKRMVATGLAETLVGKTLDSFEATGANDDGEPISNVRVLEACRRRADGETTPSEKPGLILVGDTGTGKTHLMAGMAQRYLVRGEPVLFETWPTLAKRMQAGFEDQSFREILLALCDAPVVMLDDLGAEYSARATRGWDHNWTSAQLYELVDARYRARLPLIISTNLEPADIGVRYGSRVFSRLCDLCAIALVQGRDRRLDDAHTIIFG